LGSRVCVGISNSNSNSRVRLTVIAIEQRAAETGWARCIYVCACYRVGEVRLAGLLCLLQLSLNVLDLRYSGKESGGGGSSGGGGGGEKGHTGRRRRFIQQ
jgi:uncharacterized membrane protein YgcG